MKITIIENGKTDYVIAVPINCSPVEMSGARELQEYLCKALHVTLPIVPEDAVTGKAFYVGHTAYAPNAGIRGTAGENWIMQLHQGNVVLTDGLKPHHRGNIYCVYHFLEDVVGVRWWKNLFSGTISRLRPL